ncbi:MULTISPECIES: hypothetical protein [Phaeobacter]|uniref:hypothetical protein n=1 Tax=Phaeobacter TaxID=302485 RepID=UPI0021A6F8F9|nr:hypothetical protein [Phaeobacter inhibens]UWR87242.1 hypothetical protein K4L01_10695 [Phaeobacter inhibens]
MKVSIFGMVLHEYRGVLRSNVKNDDDLSKIYENINKLCRSKLSEISKQSLIFLTISIAIHTLSGSGTLIIKTSLIQISVPEVYVLFGASLLWSSLSLNVLTLIQLMAQVVETQNFRGRTPKYHSALLNIRGLEGADLLSAARPNHIAIQPFWVVKTANLLLFSIFATVVFPLFGAGYFVTSQLLHSLFGDTDVFLAKPLAFSGLASIFCSTVYWPAYFLSFSVRKDKGFIRWLFLRGLSKSIHPQTKRWLSEK